MNNRMKSCRGCPKPCALGSSQPLQVDQRHVRSREDSTSLSLVEGEGRNRSFSASRHLAGDPMWNASVELVGGLRREQEH